MYAVIKSGGKQHRVAKGDRVKLEKLDGVEGDSVTFGEIHLVKTDDAFLVGKPGVDGASVTATIVKQGRGKKLRIFTYKRRKNCQRRMGHRQHFTEVEITGISVA